MAHGFEIGIASAHPALAVRSEPAGRAGVIHNRLCRKMCSSASAAALATFVRRPLMGERGALTGSSMVITAARGAKVAVVMLCIM